MKKNSLSTSIILFLIAIALFSIAIFNVSKTGQQNTTPISNGAKQQLAPYQEKDLMEKATIITDFENSATSSEPTNTFEKTLSINGIITDGYLYVRADVDGQALTQYDGIYMKLIESTSTMYEEYGGHLVQEQSLYTSTSTNETDFLFDLSAVKYKKKFSDSDNEFISGNWLAVLDDSSSKKVMGFSSTDRQGTIEEVDIYYQCLANTACSISSAN